MSSCLRFPDVKGGVRDPTKLDVVCIFFLIKVGDKGQDDAMFFAIFNHEMGLEITTNIVISQQSSSHT